MTYISESGNVKNIANLDKLIIAVKDFGAAYNPVKPELQIPNLEALLADATSKFNNVTNQNYIYNEKINERQILFANLKILSTRLFSALQITDASPQTIADAKAFNRKMQGQRAKAIPATPLDPNAEAPKTISVSQQSYIQQMQHLAGLVTILANTPSYNPNETDMQIASLMALQASLALANNEVEVAHSALTHARHERNLILYAPSNSIYSIATNVKKYVKATFGAKSFQFEKISSIEFKTR